MQMLELISQRAGTGNRFATLLNRIIDLAGMAQAENAIGATDKEWDMVESLLKSSRGPNHKGATGSSTSQMKSILQGQPVEDIVKFRMLLDVGQGRDFNPALYGEPTPDRIQGMIEEICSTNSLPDDLSRGRFLVKQNGVSLESNWM
jgi:hypothetical protein